MNRKELFRAAERTQTWENRTPPHGSGLPEWATREEIQALLGKTWVISPDRGYARSRYAREMNCKPSEVRFITRKEYHAAHHVALALRAAKEAEQ